MINANILFQSFEVDLFHPATLFILGVEYGGWGAHFKTAKVGSWDFRLRAVKPINPISYVN